MPGTPNVQTGAKQHKCEFQPPQIKWSDTSPVPLEIIGIGLFQTLSLPALRQWKRRDSVAPICQLELPPSNTGNARLLASGFVTVLHCEHGMACLQILLHQRRTELQPLLQSPVRISWWLTTRLAVPALRVVQHHPHADPIPHPHVSVCHTEQHQCLPLTLTHADLHATALFSAAHLSAVPLSLPLSAYSTPFFKKKKKTRKLLHLLFNTSSYIVEIMNANICHNLPTSIQTLYYINRWRIQAKYPVTSVG